MNPTPKKYVGDNNNKNHQYEREYIGDFSNKENQPIIQQIYIKKNIIGKQDQELPTNKDNYAIRQPKLKNQHKYIELKQRKFSYLDENNTKYHEDNKYRQEPQKSAQIQKSYLQNNYYIQPQKRQSYSIYQSSYSVGTSPKINCSKRVRQLEQQLQNQRNRYQLLEQRTIQSQKQLLQQLKGLQQKSTKLKNQKKNQQEELLQLKQQINKTHNIPNTQKQQMDAILKDYKKIKGFGKALMDMRKKVQGSDGDLKDAWRWAKTLVGQYELIKQYAHEWKHVYDLYNNNQCDLGQNQGEQ